MMLPHTIQLMAATYAAPDQAAQDEADRIHRFISDFDLSGRVLPTLRRFDEPADWQMGETR